MADILSPEEQRAKLAAFLRLQTAQPTFWGVADCCLLLADWVIEARGAEDPAAGLRGTYDSAEGAQAILTENGGIQSLVASLAAAAGLSETVMPVDGDIGIIMLPSGGTGAIMTRGSWAFRTPKGLVWSLVLPWRIAKAWTVFPDA